MLTLAIATLLALYAGLAWSQSWWPFLGRVDSSTNSSTPTSNSTGRPTEIDADDKKNYVDSNLGNGSDGEQATPDILIAIEPYRYNDETVVVSTRLGTIPDGTCTLTVKNGEKQDVQTADVIYQPMYSTCAGFSVPVSKLGNGTWDLVLEVESRGRQHSANGTMVVN